MARPGRRLPRLAGRHHVRKGLVQASHAVARGADAVSGTRRVGPAGSCENAVRRPVHGKGFVQLAQAVVGEANVAKGPPHVGVRGPAGTDRRVEEAAVGGKGLHVSSPPLQFQPQSADERPVGVRGRGAAIGGRLGKVGRFARVR